MEKQIFAILGAGMLAIVILGTSLRQFGGKQNIFVPPVPQQSSSSGSFLDTVTSTLQKTEQKSDGKAVIEAFFKAIGNHKPTDAVALMNEKTIGDDSQKQAWGVLFDAFQTCTIQSIEPSMKEEWTEDFETYKVTLDVEMKPESAKAPIPYYGYTKGSNIRWVSVVKQKTEWKIHGIATGP